jgi:hypothetical protein
MNNQINFQIENLCIAFINTWHDMYFNGHINPNYIWIYHFI